MVVLFGLVLLAVSWHTSVSQFFLRGAFLSYVVTHYSTAHSGILLGKLLCGFVCMCKIEEDVCFYCLNLCSGNMCTSTSPCFLP